MSGSASNDTAHNLAALVRALKRAGYRARMDPRHPRLRITHDTGDRLLFVTLTAFEGGVELFARHYERYPRDRRQEAVLVLDELHALTGERFEADIENLVLRDTVPRDRGYPIGPISERLASVFTALEKAYVHVEASGLTTTSR